MNSQFRLQSDTWTEEPLRINEENAAPWHDETEVLVVGFGGAGACAALEAAAHGAKVLLVERFEGGGATALSGGVVYAGGTRFQREAGFEDSPEEMFKYLKLETRGCVKDSTLMKFCRDSAANLEWLIEKGAHFSGKLDPRSCSYPAGGRFLYHSGNEVAADYTSQAKPAPRGHRHVGGGMTGHHIYNCLREAVLRHPSIRVAFHSPVVRLVTDASGAVLGVEMREIPSNCEAWRRHRQLIKRVNGGLWYFPKRTLRIARELLDIERNAGIRRLIRARRGVVLTTGGFVYNPEMMARHAPGHEGILRLGTVGCDGSGIRLGESVGGRSERLNYLGIGINIKLSQAYEKGIVVNRQGARFCKEDCYGAMLGRAIAEQGGKSWLITDRALHFEAWRELLAFWRKPMFELFPLSMGLLFGTRKGRTLGDLAAKCGMSAETLQHTVAQYNTQVMGGDDPLGKASKYLRPLGDGPFYALDISIDSKTTPGPTLTLGGLLVDEDSGQVVGSGGFQIPGLYAAGRTAYGIPSNWLISGTTLADVIFSGRRAGAHAASKAEISDDRQSSSL